MIDEQSEKLWILLTLCLSFGLGDGIEKYRWSVLCRVLKPFPHASWLLVLAKVRDDRSDEASEQVKKKKTAACGDGLRWARWRVEGGGGRGRVVI